VLLVGVLLAVAAYGYKFVDLRVYRDGGLVWLHGRSIYEANFPAPFGDGHLPFTYPPFAAIAFVALGVLPFGVSLAAITLISMLSLAATLWVVLRRLDVGSVHARQAAALGSLAAFGLEPVRTTLLFGQINLVLMGVVALDLLLPRTRWPRGLLVGLAAAVKLTPAVFVLFFVVRRDWRAVAASIAGFGAAVLLAMFLAPHDSRIYWTSLVFQSNRIGQPSFAANESLYGILARLTSSAEVHGVMWPALCAVAVGIGALAAYRARRAGDDAIAMLALAATGLIVSPISWSHHWVWSAPAAAMVIVGVARGGLPRTWRGWLAAACGVAALLVFGIGGQQFLEQPQTVVVVHWNWWRQVVGNSYLWTALVFLVYAAFIRRQDRGDVSPHDQSAERVASLP
jgi:alpha-1,2-mannosyltransferase